MDDLTKKQRSYCMSRIKSKHTKPELIVRRILRNLGCKYILHAKHFAGKPDIVIKDKKTIIFINGCFWHQHKGCKRAIMPKSNIKYWHKKLMRNIEKQKKDIMGLKKSKWKIFIIWECQAKNEKALVRRIKGMLG